jgi:HK97 family phage major capsid protein
MKTETPISLLDIITSKATGTWGRVDSAGFRASCDMHERYGIPNSGYDLLPATVFASRATPLTAASSSGGGYLDGTSLLGYLPALTPQTNLLRLGATQVPLAKNTTVTPRGVTALTPTWLHDEVTATAETTQTFGQITFARKSLLVTVRLSRQLLLQSNAEEIVRIELARAAGAEIDKQGIQGIGLLGTPLGILNIPAIASASGAALTYSELVTAMTGVANSNAVVDPQALGFLTTPTVAGVLKQRYFSTANFPIWTGSIPSGLIDTQTALSSTNVPVGSLLHADFSRLLVAEWADGLQIDVDPFTNFQTAFVTVRLCVAVDFQIASPLSFSILTGIT